MHSRYFTQHFCTLVSLAVLLTTTAPSFAEHEHHHHDIAKDTGYTVAAADITLPDMVLLSRHATPQKLAAIVGDEPLLLNFIFTTCTAICPTMTATFMEVQNKAAKQHIKIKLVSISIDPEQDTPGALQDYARKYHAGNDWEFYTGDKTNIINVQKAFKTYRGNKMNHIPITFIRSGAKAQWVRIEGFASAAELLNEFKQATSK
jgi:protein SCO1